MREQHALVEAHRGRIQFVQVDLHLREAHQRLGPWLDRAFWVSAQELERVLEIVFCGVETSLELQDAPTLEEELRLVDARERCGREHGEHRECFVGMPRSSRSRAETYERAEDLWAAKFVARYSQ